MPRRSPTAYIGLSLLVGSIMLIDLRLLGVARNLPLRSMLGLLPFVWAGFVINVKTGTLIFIYGATSGRAVDGLCMSAAIFVARARAPIVASSER